MSRRRSIAHEPHLDFIILTYHESINHSTTYAKHPNMLVNVQVVINNQFTSRSYLFGSIYYEEHTETVLFIGDRRELQRLTSMSSDVIC